MVIAKRNEDPYAEASAMATWFVFICFFIVGVVVGVVVVCRLSFVLCPLLLLLLLYLLIPFKKEEEKKKMHLVVFVLRWCEICTSSNL